MRVEQTKSGTPCLQIERERRNVSVVTQEDVEPNHGQHWGFTVDLQRPRSNTLYAYVPNTLAESHQYHHGWIIDDLIALPTFWSCFPSTTSLVNSPPT